MDQIEPQLICISHPFCGCACSETSATGACSSLPLTETEAQWPIYFQLNSQTHFLARFCFWSPSILQLASSSLQNCQQSDVSLLLWQGWLTWWNSFMAAWNGNWKTRKYFSSDWCRRTGVCLGGGGKSTHYVRAIAVFKTSLSLCVTHLSCFWTDGDGGSQEEGGEDWLVVIYKHYVLWLPFPRLKHKKRLVTHRCFFFLLFHTSI